MFEDVFQLLITIAQGVSVKKKKISPLKSLFEVNCLTCLVNYFDLIDLICAPWEGSLKKTLEDHCQHNMFHVAVECLMVCHYFSVSAQTAT